MAKQIVTQEIKSQFWNAGINANEAIGVYRAAVKSGCNEQQAFEIAKLSFYAAKSYDWKFEAKENPCWNLHRVTVERNAAEYPNGKCAEDLAAQREGRPSRWGTPEFHGNA